MFSSYSQLFFCLIIWRVWLFEYLWAVLFLFWILSLCISVASLWDSSSFGSFDINLHKIFLSWWVDWIISNISSWMQKYSWSEKVPSSSSGNQIKVHPSVLSNCNCSWSMKKKIPDLHHIEPDNHILQETWLLILGSCSLYAIFLILQYIISTLCLLLHMNSETTSQHPIGLIDSQRRGPHHSKNDCVNYL